MGTYPLQYPAPAITVAEDLVLMKFRERLKKEGWSWTASPYLLSEDELDTIQLRFAPGVQDATLERFIGLVFAKTLPLLHLEFRTDGYLLEIEGNQLVIKELPPSSDGIAYRPEVRKNALKVVRSLIEWSLTDYADRTGVERWPLGINRHDLVRAGWYPWIQQIGEIGYCRTSYVIDYVHEAVPDLRAEWESDGLVLRPVYHDFTNGMGKCMIALQLVPKSPA